jgi:hypothetical protein
VLVPAHPTVSTNVCEPGAKLSAATKALLEPPVAVGVSPPSPPYPTSTLRPLTSIASENPQPYVVMSYGDDGSDAPVCAWSPLSSPRSQRPA